MKIAITSQNRRTVTAHAGRCRRFWVYDVEDGRVTGKALLELAKTDTLHEVSPGIPHELTAIDALVSTGMCDNLVARLQRNGIEARQTACEDPDEALQRVMPDLL
jgi:predicted Fe-Mo cluster-binding NifX family protein